jgi:hypothetical protein
MLEVRGNEQRKGRERKREKQREREKNREKERDEEKNEDEETAKWVKAPGHQTPLRPAALHNPNPEAQRRPHQPRPGIVLPREELPQPRHPTRWVVNRDSEQQCYGTGELLDAAMACIGCTAA